MVVNNSAMASAAIINTEHLTFVGAGQNRNVYVHPADANLCVKVLRPERIGQPRQHKVLRQEANYYKHLAKRGVAGRHIARFHGCIQVRQGDAIVAGNVFELIRNYDGQISKILRAELKARPGERQNLLRAYRALHLEMLRERIISAGYSPHNIVVQWAGGADSPPKCMMVDDVWNGEFWPLSTHIAAFARRKIIRRWRRELAKHFPAEASALRD